MISEETRKKMSLAKKLRPVRYWLGKHTVITEETKEKLRQSMLGRDAYWLKGKFKEQASAYKGDEVKVDSIHKWLVNRFGKASNYVCMCGKKAVHWANKDHKYTRNEKDYIPLCVSCHRKYDIKFNGYNVDNFKHSRPFSRKINN